MIRLIYFYEIIKFPEINNQYHRWYFFNNQRIITPGLLRIGSLMKFDSTILSGRKMNFLSNISFPM